MRLRRLCLEILAFRRFFSEPIEISRFPGAQCKHRKQWRATVLSLRRQLVQRLPDQTDVLLGFYLSKNRSDPSGTVDDESAPLRAHVFFAVHALLHPDAETVYDFLFRV